MNFLNKCSLNKMQLNVQGSIFCINLFIKSNYFWYIVKGWKYDLIFGVRLFFFSLDINVIYLFSLLKFNKLYSYNL